MFCHNLTLFIQETFCAPTFLTHNISFRKQDNSKEMSPEKTGLAVNQLVSEISFDSNENSLAYNSAAFVLHSFWQRFTQFQDSSLYFTS